MAHARAEQRCRCTAACKDTSLSPSTTCASPRTFGGGMLCSGPSTRRRRGGRSVARPRTHHHRSRREAAGEAVMKAAVPARRRRDASTRRAWSTGSHGCPGASWLARADVSGSGRMNASCPGAFADDLVLHSAAGSHLLLPWPRRCQRLENRDHADPEARMHASRSRHAPATSSS